MGPPRSAVKDSRVRFERRLRQLRDRFIAVDLRSRSLRLTRASRVGAFDLCRLREAAPKAFGDLLTRLGSASPGTLSLLEARPGEPALDSLKDSADQLSGAVEPLGRLAERLPGGKR